MTQYAIVAATKNGTSMVVSVHSNEEEAELELQTLRMKNDLWFYSIQKVVE